MNIFKYKHLQCQAKASIDIAQASRMLDWIQKFSFNVTSCNILFILC